MMKRATVYLSIGLLIVALVISLYIYAIVQESASLKRLALTAPWTLLIWLGCYCLLRLGFDLLTFRNCPLEIRKLEKVSSTLYRV